MAQKQEKTNLWIEHGSSNVTIITLAMALTFCWSCLTSYMSGMNGPIATKQNPKNHWLNARHQMGDRYNRKLPGRLLMFVCKKHLVNTLRPNDAYMPHQPRPSLVQIMACCLTNIWSMIWYCWLDPWEQTSVKSLSKFKYFHSRKCI